MELALAPNISLDVVRVSSIGGWPDVAALVQ